MARSSGSTGRPPGFRRVACDNPAMGMVREVRIAKRTGFCYGGREAVDKAEGSADAGKRTQTLGQGVHNEGVVAGLGARGGVSIAELAEADPGSTVVILARRAPRSRPRC